MALSLFVAVTLGVGFTDYLWAKYIMSIEAGARWKAAYISGLIQLVSSEATLAYVEHTYLIVAATLGAVLGTLVAFRGYRHADAA